MISNAQLKPVAEPTVPDADMLGRVVRVIRTCGSGEYMLEVLVERKTDDGFHGRVLHIMDEKGVNIVESPEMHPEDPVEFSADKIAAVKDA